MTERSASSALRWLRHQLRCWDKGDRVTRTKMLDEFIERHAHETGPQLEKYYGNGASLFLTRISAWLKLTYVESIALDKQLNAISIFLSAANGTRYLAEFVDFGGLLSILDLLSIKEIDEQDKCSALKLLLQIAHAGRFYKELICSFNGMQVTVGLLEQANFPHTRLLVYDVFLVLGSGNPKYSNKVQAEIIAMIPGASSLPEAPEQLLVCLVAVVAVVSILSTILSIAGRWKATQIVKRLQARLRKSVFDHVKNAVSPSSQFVQGRKIYNKPKARK